MGEGVRLAMKEFNIAREELFITTKILPWSLGKEKTKKSIETSLKNLDLGYIDLMLIHFPGAKDLKPNDIRNKTLRHETWKVMEEYVGKGLI